MDSKDLNLHSILNKQGYHPNYTKDLLEFLKNNPD